ISLVFFVLLLASLPLAVGLITDFSWGAAAGGLAILLMLSGTELMRYAFSAMLETQGMFFMLWACFFIVRLYDSTRTFSRWDLAGLAVAFQGVMHTKYPYGVMLLIAVAGLELVRNPRQYGQLAVTL